MAVNLWQVLDMNLNSSSMTQQQGNLSQASCATPPCTREHARASFCLVFKSSGLSPFPSGNQNCYPTLASAVIDALQCVLGPMVAGGMKSTLGSFLNNGDLARAQTLLGVIVNGYWSDSWKN